mmetsp:Transcript_50821/g.91332  ORF Transcript_50821/g.91332 Transcript_50821/m.91332 type:complete len:116 (-) Transcript_50821:183-530(-)|eukprot:CAMPEP_0197642138 /NCGR_PEP_ID=MMETSP1338-20131121/15890_1 /TAXON_ID=43686 ORGANISM="Pelagodinium beii, Strain RCC1491" /NCGR_SAMPLE_ID=MMETSP1338 /ASSEMBLY_ACC=CAM_ASM_000754 /LENGTH=115 /DNA_ID=CAMNT_0043215223 /DNA_START=55 /DNA_END=402 /DNA_ORIENTATION=-
MAMSSEFRLPAKSSALRKGGRMAVVSAELGDARVWAKALSQKLSEQKLVSTMKSMRAKPPTVHSKFGLVGRKAHKALKDVTPAQRSEVLKAALSTYRQVQHLLKEKRLSRKMHHV